MTIRPLVALIAVLSVALAFAPVTAQSDDDAALEFVLQAVARLNEGYRYSVDADTAQQFYTEDDADDFASFTQQHIEGTVAANGDYYVAVVTNAGETLETVGDYPPVEYAQVSYEGVIYINFESLDSLYGDVLPGIDTGWLNLDSYRDSLEDEFDRVVLDNLTTLRLPAALLADDTLIRAVEELASETLDGVEMRVFSIELDALAILIEQSPLTPEQRLLLFVEQMTFLAKSDLSLTYTVWIGAEDGLLYQGESVGRNDLPYLSEGDGQPPYDMEVTSRSSVCFYDHGVVESIDLPDEVAALAEE